MACRTLVALFMLTWMSAAGLAVEAGDRAPAWTAKDFAGRVVEFPAVNAGQPTVMVFWATWCGYCRAFMPYLKDISADYAEQGVRIVAINAKEDGSGNPRSYVRGLGFEPIAIADGDDIAAAYDIEFIPGLLIVDGNGTVAYRRPWTDLPAGRTVAELWSEQVRQALDKLL